MEGGHAYHHAGLRERLSLGRGVESVCRKRGCSDWALDGYRIRVDGRSLGCCSVVLEHRRVHMLTGVRIGESGERCCSSVVGWVVRVGIGCSCVCVCGNSVGYM